MSAFRRVLVATSLNPASAAFARGVLLARKWGAELLIAHAYRPPNVSLAEAVAPGVFDEWDQNLRVEASRGLQVFVEAARRQLVVAWPLVLRGAPRKAVVQAARENRADLIVVGSHRRRRLFRFFSRTFASRIAVSAPCRVLEIRDFAPEMDTHPYLHRVA